ncbi:hypothetical protein ACFQH5_20435 [Halomonas salifodinae]|uniref:Uncharacterized protein n=1 Tax=Halomonas salifodinae TaxID=438745 RepID=A0ABW2F1K4_9GAMM
MNSRYLVKQGGTPRCDLPGSPYFSRIAAKRAAAHAGIESPVIIAVKRRLG